MSAPQSPTEPGRIERLVTAVLMAAVLAALLIALWASSTGDAPTSPPPKNADAVDPNEPKRSNSPASTQSAQPAPADSSAGAK